MINARTLNKSQLLYGGTSTTIYIAAIRAGRLLRDSPIPFYKISASKPLLCKHIQLGMLHTYALATTMQEKLHKIKLSPTDTSYDM